jgi:surfactin synthase thioesterase subunit
MRWSRRTPDWFDVAPVELPGRGSRAGEAPIADYGRLVEKLANDLAPDACGEYALLGHSMGALLAFGCAHALLDRGAPAPRALIIAAAAAPERFNAAKFARRKSNAELLEELRGFNSVPAEIFDDAEMVRLVIAQIALDYRVCGSFQPGPRQPLSIPIIAYSGRQDAVDEDAVRAWGKETSADFTLEMFDGGHFFLRAQEDEFLAHLTRRLSTLRRA